MPEAPLDVLAQHLVSMGCTQRWRRAEALALVRRACAVRASCTEAEFDDVLDYLAGGGESLRRQYSEVFGRIELDERELRDARRAACGASFCRISAPFPMSSSVRVRLQTQVLGSVEESFMRMLKIGDVFIMAGRAGAARAREPDGCLGLAAPMAKRPTVPRWNAAKMPLSNRVCEEIIDFRSELRARLESGALPGRTKEIAPRGSPRGSIAARPMPR